MSDFPELDDSKGVEAAVFHKCAADLTLQRAKTIVKELKTRFDDKSKDRLVPFSPLHNRYIDILPYEDTRVKLNSMTETIKQIDSIPADAPEAQKVAKETLHTLRSEFKDAFDYVFVEQADYINASAVNLSLDGFEFRPYISAMAPIEGFEQAAGKYKGYPKNTLGTFWRLIWERRISTVVMLTKETEGTKKKANKYWATNLPEGKSRSFFPMMVSTKGVRSEEREVDLSEGKGLLFKRRQVVEHMVDGKPLEVTLFQYCGWPDFGVPTDFETFVKLLSEYRRVRDIEQPDCQDRMPHPHPVEVCNRGTNFFCDVCNKEQLELGAKKRFRCSQGCDYDLCEDCEKKPTTQRGHAPSLVHCSAGVGRSATFILLDCLLDFLSRDGANPRLTKDALTPPISLYTIIKQMRHARCQMVQSGEQLKFIHDWLAWCLQNNRCGIGLLPKERS
mmetsp:Transcript_5192/g.8144  ORF Transcript_5192/g.8144 Transcript_5192/m.8144 type:complete len:447 (+) Transcript_5192:37-1377(+)